MPDPAAAMTSPPNAGPMARATLNPAEFSATPAAKFCCETVSGVIACHAGSFSTAPKPISNATTSSKVGVTLPARVSTPSAGGRQHHPGLGEEQQLAAIDHIGDGARRQHHEKHCDAARRLHQSHHQRRHGERRHQPCGADVLHPGAGVADDGGDPEGAEQRLLQRSQGAAPSGVATGIGGNGPNCSTGSDPSKRGGSETVRASRCCPPTSPTVGLAGEFGSCHAPLVAIADQTLCVGKGKLSCVQIRSQRCERLAIRDQSRWLSQPSSRNLDACQSQQRMATHAVSTNAPDKSPSRRSGSRPRSESRAGNFSAPAE